MPQQAVVAPQQAAAPPAAAPPRPGPPVGVKRPKAKRDLSRLPVHDVAIDESVAERSTFSPAVLGLMVGVLLMGLLFGYMFAQSSQARGLYDKQTVAAEELLEVITPKLQKGQEVVQAIGAMDASKPNYEATAAINAIDFVPSAGTINARTVFLGGDIVYDITTYMSKATTLKQMIRRHEDLTLQDKEELDQIMQGSELLNSEKLFAIIYNHKQLLDHTSSKSADDQYKPNNGRLVALDALTPDDEGKLPFTYVNSTTTGEWPILGVIPLQDKDLMKTEGKNNALERYKMRVDTLKRYALDLDKHIATLDVPIKEVASREGAPLFQFSDPSTPSASTPRAEAEAEVDEVE